MAAKLLGIMAARRCFSLFGCFKGTEQNTKAKYSHLKQVFWNQLYTLNCDQFSQVLMLVEIMHPVCGVLDENCAFGIRIGGSLL